MATLNHEPRASGLTHGAPRAPGGGGGNPSGVHDSNHQDPPELSGVLHHCAERLADLRLRGVKGLRTTAGHVLAEAAASVHRPATMPNDFDANMTSADHLESLPSSPPSGLFVVCQRCPVCQPAAGRFIADASAMTPGRLLVVLEFPGVGPDAQTDLANTQGANHLIERLLQRAGLRGDAAFSYALRGVPKGAPRAENLSLCSSLWLAAEIAARQPEIILCFGSRAESAVAMACSRHEHPTARQVLNFPSAHELKLFPEWRQDVWRAVSALTAGGA